MKQTTMNATKRIEALEAECYALAEELSHATIILRDEGQPIDSVLYSRIDTLRQEIERICNELRTWAATLAIGDLPESFSVSLRIARQIIQQISVVEEDIGRDRATVIALLDQVLNLATIDEPKFEALDACQQAALQLRTAILDVAPPDLHPEALEIAQGIHPFASLMVLIIEPQSLDDTRYDEHLVRVERAFGRAMEIALVRQRLVLRSPNQPPAISIDDKREDTSTTGEDGTSLLDNGRDLLSDNLTDAGIVEAQALAATHLLDTQSVSLDDRYDEPTIASERETSQPATDSRPFMAGSLDNPVAAPYPTLLETVDIPSNVVGLIDRESILETNDTHVVSTHPINLSDLPETSEIPESIEQSPVRQLAQQLMNVEPNQRDTGMRELLFLLLFEQRSGFAYHVACVYKEMYADREAAPAPWLVQALVIGPYLHSAYGVLAQALQESYLEFETHALVWETEPKTLAANLLAVAATLPIVLLAPETGAGEILNSVPLDTLPKHCATLCLSVTQFFRTQQPIDAATINLLNDHAAWQQEWQDLQIEARNYWNDVEHKRLIYAPATEVWHNWTRSQGFVHRMLSAILDDNVNLLKDALDAANRVGTSKSVKREVQHTDRQVIERSIGADIRDTALEKIGTLSQDAVKLTRRWARICETRPSPEIKGRLDRIAELRGQVEASLPLARAELAAIEQRDGDLVEIRCALMWCQRAFDRIADVIHQHPEENANEPTLHRLLHGPLLRAPEIALDAQWDPGPVTSAFADALLTAIAQDDGTWQSVLDTHHAADNHEATKHIIEYLEMIEPESARVITLAQRRHLQLQWLRASMQSMLETVRIETGKAAVYDLTSEEEVLQYEAILQSLSHAIGLHSRFDKTRAELQALRTDIEHKVTAGIVRIEQSIERAQLSDDHPARPWIQRALKERDPLAANEYLTLALEGHDLPDPAVEDDVFKRFFLRDFRGLTDYLSSNGDLLTIVQSLREVREPQMPLQIGPVTISTGPQAFDAARLIEAWYEVKRTFARTAPLNGWKITNIKPIVRTMFDLLGFTTKDVTMHERPSRRLWMTVTTEVLHDKDLCPIRTYGSSAEGHYRLLIIPDRATEEDIIAEIADPVKGMPPIVIFYFGRLLEHQRRRLAMLCREKHRTCILIDDTLMLFLSEYRPPRLGKMFESTLPFTYLEPYVTTASVVPYEVFYGRQREQDEILDPMGSCFIYGGRQLGKTALLRHVEEVAHDPANGRIVRWIDLKTESIGLKIDIDAVWEVIARELKPFDVIPSNLPPTTSAETYFKYIETWLRIDTKRRIVLLLDETDHFLDSDGSHRDKFQRTSRIKGLMDRTNRRFKVVFAGLHNLQRTTRQENNPLAHYGRPLRIGPLLEDGEWREARGLIERPLASLGYRFTSPDLVTRILSQTNYYPSLLQLYGAEMVRYLSEPYRALFPLNESPPYTITSKHLEAIYRSQELHDGIRHRFRLTLELDPRYEVITYIVASNALDDEQQILLNGMRVAEIREQSLGSWPQGFAKDPSEEMFLTLLEELIGLGIFRRVNGNHFTLRNANMLLLVGSREQVIAELRRERELPPGYDAATFRSAFTTDPADHSGLARRSPLTAKQESDLRNSGHGVTILFGNAAAGLPAVGTYLRQSLGQGFVVEMIERTSEADFNQALQNLAQRERNGTTLLLVQPDSGWNTGWVEQAHQRLSRLTSRTDFARVVFIADPGHSWRLLSQEGVAFEQALANMARPINLMPWQDAALHQWIIDCAISPNGKDERAQVTQVTGNWSSLLLRYYQRVRDVPARWQKTLKAIATEIDDAHQQRDLVTALGLTPNEPVRVLTTMAVLNESKPIATADLAYLLADELPRAVIHRSLRWADLLSLVSPAGPNQWTLQPLVARVLLHQKKEQP